MKQETTPMDCARFEEFVHDLDRPGTDGFVFRETALAHAEYCGRCAQVLTRVESLDLDLRSLAVHQAGQQAPSHVQTALMEAFRRENAASSRRRLTWQIASLGVAAALLIVLGFSLRYRSEQTSGSANPRKNAVSTEQGKPAQAVKSAPQVASAPDSRAPQPQAAKNQADDSEYAAAFTPLPYADDPSALDGGAVVRVVLSQSALASLGVPVANVDDTNGVSADLVVSEDGTPQAIRLVSQSNLN
jgi:hypothetical protein